MGYHNEETRAGVQGTLTFSFLLLILISTDNAGPTQALSTKRHPSRMSLHVRHHHTPFEHGDRPIMGVSACSMLFHTIRAWKQTHRGCLCMLNAVPHHSSMERDLLQVSQHARCCPTPFKHRETPTHLSNLHFKQSHTIAQNARWMCPPQRDMLKKISFLKFFVYNI